MFYQKKKKKDQLFFFYARWVNLLTHKPFWAEKAQVFPKLTAKMATAWKPVCICKYEQVCIC